MNGPHHLKLFIACFLLVHFSCSDCHRIRCETHENLVHIRLLHNGKNAVFGPDALIDRDSIRFFIPHVNHPDTEYPIIYIDSTQSLRLSLAVGNSQFLTYPGGTDTLYGHYFMSQWTECCSRYMLISLLWNAEEVCKDDCGEVIDIEI